MAIIKAMHYYRYFFKYAEEGANRKVEESSVHEGNSSQKSDLLERAHRRVFRYVQPLLRCQEAVRYCGYTQHSTHTRF